MNVAVAVVLSTLRLLSLLVEKEGSEKGAERKWLTKRFYSFLEVDRMDLKIGDCKKSLRNSNKQATLHFCG
jgi:hypothetical protein